MKLALLSEASQQWRHIQERGFEQVAEDTASMAATTVQMVTRSLSARDGDTTCKPDDNSAACQKPTTSGSTQTIAIALGAGIPLACAVIVLIFLHRRHVNKQRLEDLNDPHKSLDFGMNTPSAGKGGKDLPEMTITDLGPDPMRPGRKGGRHGLSMDMSTVSNPYLLPAELNDSSGSIHSMSRSFQDTHDPYRPVTFIKNSSDSIRSPSNPFADKASVYSAATSFQSNGESSGPFANPSYPRRGDSKSQKDSASPVDTENSDELPLRQMHSQNRSVPGSRRPSQGSEPILPNIQENAFVPPPPPPPPEKEQPVRPPRSSSVSAGSAGLPSRKESIPRVPVPPRESSNYGDDIEVTPASPPRIAEPELQYDIPASMISTGRMPLDEPAPQPTGLAMPQPQNNRLSVMGLRPLPSDLPEDNPEVRANRIRSFYKEYFDDSKPNNSGEDDLLADGAIYDPATGQFVTAHRPFAQPVGRRAMTPPPRGAMGPGGWSRGATPTNPHRRHNSTQSAWGRGGPRGRAPPMPKKRAPPPAPLKNLPTPHLLKDDTAIFNADDFAPPVSYRDRQAGRSASPVNGSRPYSPAVSAHVPLVSAYNELSPMPSPYLLRKSGTFTALDFAPPGVFSGQANANDAGSIRSNRSGISAMQQDAIRAGAYRVSRIPTDMVGTRDDLAAQLKPSWNMRRGDKVTG